mgnify:CR=1 FL=1
MIQKGSVVVGDNIIFPGVPDYLDFFKNSKDYDSVLYFSENYGNHKKDGVLVSVRL